MSAAAVVAPIDVGALVPDGIEPVEALRCWSLGNSNLCSMNGHRWTPGEPLVAGCTREQGYRWSIVRGGASREMAEAWVSYRPSRVPKVPTVEPPSGYGFQLDPFRHGAPHEACTCGIYAASDWKIVEPYEMHGQTVRGRVKMWGKIIPGDNGYRAEYAYPSEFIVPASLANDPTLAAFGVPITIDETVAAVGSAPRRRRDINWTRVAIGANVGACALNLSLVGLHVFH